MGHNLIGFRGNLPVVKGGVGHRAGRWHLLMTLALKSPTTRTAATRFDDVGLTDTAVLRYEAIVHARSNLRMRSEEHTSELQSLMSNSYAVQSLKKKNHNLLASTLQHHLL